MKLFVIYIILCGKLQGKKKRGTHVEWWNFSGKPLARSIVGMISILIGRGDDQFWSHLQLVDFLCWLLSLSLIDPSHSYSHQHLHDVRSLDSEYVLFLIGAISFLIIAGWIECIFEIGGRCRLRHIRINSCDEHFWMFAHWFHLWEISVWQLNKTTKISLCLTCSFGV